MAAHSHIGFSAAHRWMRCPGSVKLIRDTGLGGETSPYAEEGTRAHKLAESCLKRGLTGVPMAECDDREMRAGVDLFLAYVWKAFTAHPGRGQNGLITEQRMELAHIHPDLFSTLDAAVYQSATRHLHIFDFKYGAGVPVEAEGNAQLLGYLLMAFCHLKAKGVKINEMTITIVQPRFDHPDGRVRSCKVSKLELLDFEMELEAAVARIETQPEELNAGPWCKFCPARPACPALHNKALQVAGTEFEVIPDGDVKSLVRRLSLEEAAQRFTFAKWLQMYSSALYAYLLAEAERGRLAPGFKLVPKQGRRKWKNEKDAKSLLTGRFGLETLALKSPFQIEKQVGKAEFKRWAYLAETKSSGVKLVPTAAKGTALTALEFEPLEEDEGEDGDE